MARRYRDAGVDIDEARRTVELIASAAAATSRPEVLAGIGGFAGLFRFDPSAYPDPVLVASTDPVGTKLLVAAALGRLDTIGIDLVHQNVNDIAVVGADPLFLLDYLAVGRLSAEMAATIVGGVARACAALGVTLLGGETAELPDLHRDGEFDLSATIVGAVARADIIDGAGVRSGDLLLGLPSSGLHTNGYALVRRLFPANQWDRSAPGLEGLSLGDELLIPHRSYLDEVRLLRRALRAGGGDLLAMAHITGGGWIENVPRTLPPGLGVEVETGSWPVPPIFSLIQQRGDIADEEMVRTFNLGIGLTAVIRADQLEAAQRAVPEVCAVGRVVAVEPGRPRVAFV